MIPTKSPVMKDPKFLKDREQYLGRAFKVNPFQTPRVLTDGARAHKYECMRRNLC